MDNHATDPTVLLQINSRLSIAKSEYQFSAIRAQGAGGQHVNKVSTAVQLRFDIAASSLPDQIQQKLLNCSDSRISKDGVLLIKAQEYRSQLRNKQLAEQKLSDIISKASITLPPRKATRPKKAAVRKRLDKKAQNSALKKLRKKVDY